MLYSEPLLGWLCSSWRSKYCERFKYRAYCSLIVHPFRGQWRHMGGGGTQNISFMQGYLYTEGRDVKGVSNHLPLQFLLFLSWVYV